MAEVTGSSGNTPVNPTGNTGNNFNIDAWLLSRQAAGVQFAGWLADALRTLVASFSPDSVHLTHFQPDTQTNTDNYSTWFSRGLESKWDANTLKNTVFNLTKGASTSSAEGRQGIEPLMIFQYLINLRDAGRANGGVGTYTASELDTIFSGFEGGITGNTFGPDNQSFSDYVTDTLLSQWAAGGDLEAFKSNFSAFMSDMEGLKERSPFKEVLKNLKGIKSAIDDATSLADITGLNAELVGNDSLKGAHSRWQINALRLSLSAYMPDASTFNLTAEQILSYTQGIDEHITAADSMGDIWNIMGIGENVNVISSIDGLRGHVAKLATEADSTEKAQLLLKYLINIKNSNHYSPDELRRIFGGLEGKTFGDYNQTFADYMSDTILTQWADADGMTLETFQEKFNNFLAELRPLRSAEPFKGMVKILNRLKPHIDAARTIDDVKALNKLHARDASLANLAVDVALSGWMAGALDAEMNRYFTAGGSYGQRDIDNFTSFYNRGVATKDDIADLKGHLIALLDGASSHTDQAVEPLFILQYVMNLKDSGHYTANELSDILAVFEGKTFGPFSQPFDEYVIDVYMKTLSGKEGMTASLFKEHFDLFANDMSRLRGNPPFSKIYANLLSLQPSITAANSMNNIKLVIRLNTRTTLTTVGADVYFAGWMADLLNDLLTGSSINANMINSWFNMDLSGDALTRQLTRLTNEAQQRSLTGDSTQALALFQYLMLLKREGKDISSFKNLLNTISFGSQGQSFDSYIASSAIDSWANRDGMTVDEFKTLFNAFASDVRSLQGSAPFDELLTHLQLISGTVTRASTMEEIKGIKIQPTTSGLSTSMNILFESFGINSQYEVGLFDINAGINPRLDASNIASYAQQWFNYLKHNRADFRTTMDFVQWIGNISAAFPNDEGVQKVVNSIAGLKYTTESGEVITFAQHAADIIYLAHKMQNRPLTPEIVDRLFAGFSTSGSEPSFITDLKTRVKANISNPPDRFDKYLQYAGTATGRRIAMYGINSSFFEGVGSEELTNAAGVAYNPNDNQLRNLSTVALDGVEPGDLMGFFSVVIGNRMSDGVQKIGGISQLGVHLTEAIQSVAQLSKGFSAFIEEAGVNYTSADRTRLLSESIRPFLEGLRDTYMQVDLLSGYIANAGLKDVLDSLISAIDEEFEGDFKAMLFNDFDGLMAKGGDIVDILMGKPNVPIGTADPNLTDYPKHAFNGAYFTRGDDNKIFAYDDNGVLHETNTSATPDELVEQFGIDRANIIYEELIMSDNTVIYRAFDGTPLAEGDDGQPIFPESERRKLGGLLRNLIPIGGTGGRGEAPIYTFELGEGMTKIMEKINVATNKLVNQSASIQTDVSNTSNEIQAAQNFLAYIIRILKQMIDSAIQKFNSR